jgi:hypothetical protein
MYMDALWRRYSGCNVCVRAKHLDAHGRIGVAVLQDYRKSKYALEYRASRIVIHTYNCS